MSEFTAGPKNSLADVAGLLVGNADDPKVRTGVSVVICPPDTVASVQVLGGAPGTRETDLMDPANSVPAIDAVVLSGGSAFGLDAASGVQAALREQGKGLEVAGQRIPIVPAAILFDLINGGDKAWGRYSPYRDLGYEAVTRAGPDFELGTAGAGFGALTAGLKGGLGSASAVLDDGSVVAALVAVNSVGSATIPGTRHFWAAPFELAGEFGGLGFPSPIPDSARSVPIKLREMQTIGANTTIGVIATSAKLNKSEAKRLAIAAHGGYARAIWPSHTLLDGDLIFSLATGTTVPPSGAVAMADLCAIGAMTMGRAIARAVYLATPADGDRFPAWSELP